MARPRSTIVVLVGAEATAILAGLDLLPNVRAATTRDLPEPAQALELAARAHTPYFVHDADPLEAVGTAWSGFFETTAPYGTLEVAVEAALASLRREQTLLPDYYLVLNPDDLPVTLKHWWLGAVAAAAPSRVLPARASVASVHDTLARLPAGRWWPDPVADWLHGLGREVPDRVGLPSFSGRPQPATEAN